MSIVQCCLYFFKFRWYARFLPRKNIPSYRVSTIWGRCAPWLSVYQYRQSAAASTYLLHLSVITFTDLHYLLAITSLQPVQSVSYYLSATCSVCQLLHLCNLLNLSVITFRNLPTETVNYNICTPVQTDIDSDEIQNALLCNKMLMKIVLYTVYIQYGCLDNSSI